MFRARGLCRLMGHVRQHASQSVLRPSTSTNTVTHRWLSVSASPENEDEALQRIISRISNPGIIHIDKALDGFTRSDNVAELFGALVKFDPKDRPYILQHEQFHKILGSLLVNVAELSTPDATELLRSMFVLLGDDGSELTSEIETHLERNLEKFTYKQLNELHQLYKSHKDRKLHSKIDEISIKRWNEIENPGHLMDLLRGANADQTKLLLTRAGEIAEKFTVYELYVLLCIMHQTKYRNTTLVRSISYNLSKHTFRFSRLKLITMGDAISDLHIFDSTLLTKWCDAVTYSYQPDRDQLEYKADVEKKLYNSITNLRWQDTEMTQAIGNHVINNVARLSPYSLDSLLGMYATLDTLPTMLRELLPWLLAQGQINQQLCLRKPRTYLEVMWNLAVLEVLRDTQLTPNNILPASLVKQLKSHVKEAAYPAVCSKLMNLSTAISHVYPDCDTLLPLDFLQSQKLQVPIRKNRPLTTKVVQALSDIVNKDHIRLDVQNPLGYTIDVEFCVNYEGNVTSQDDPDSQMVAVKVLEFADCLQSGKGPIGRYSMMARHLEKADYKVILVPCYELSDLHTAEKLQEYLKTKLNLCT